MRDQIDELLAEAQRKIAGAGGYGPYDWASHEVEAHLRTISYRIRCLIAEDMARG